MDRQSNITLRTQNNIPLIGLGTWKLTKNTTAVVLDALRLGYRMIDTSGDYGTQRPIGEAIRSGAVQRQNIYIVTKVEETDDAYQATQNDLDELGLEYADLMLIHRPPQVGSGLELWQGLLRAKQEGLTKDIGVSNYSVARIQELIDATGEIPAVNQIEWTPFGHSKTMLEYCRQHNIVIQAYSPLTHSQRLDEPILQEIAAHYDKTPAQLLVRWNIQLGTVPLPKASSVTHLAENIDVFDFAINGDDMATLNGLNEGYSIFGSLPYD